MSILVAIEGADGAGKATAAENVRAALVDLGYSATVISFPRYKETVGGIALGEFLSGRMPVQVTPKAAAVLYALDRLESVSAIADAANEHDVVIFDRYIPSNMVYQASKVSADQADAMMRWIYILETETFGVPAPDLSIYLNTPLDTARRLMKLKDARSYTDLQFDEHEADLALQRAVRINYLTMADMNLAGPWHTVFTTVEDRLRSPAEISSEISGIVIQRIAELRDQGSDRMMASRA